MTTPRHDMELDRLADALRIAERTRTPIDQVSAGRPWLTVADARPSRSGSCAHAGRRVRRSRAGRWA